MFTGADFYREMVATAPRRKTRHRAPPPCEELDPATLAVSDTCGNDIKLVSVQKITVVPIGKSTKTAATGAALFNSNVHKSLVGWSLQRSPDPPAVFRGPTSKGK